MTVEYREVTGIDSQVREFIPTAVRRDPVVVKIEWADVQRFDQREDMRKFVENKLWVAGADTRFGRVEIEATAEPMIFMATWYP